MQLKMPTFLSIILFCGVLGMCTSQADRVEISHNSTGYYELLVNGESFFANGAGAEQHLELFKELGGNAIRTWGVDQLELQIDGKPFLDHAHELGLKVVAGIWVEHERHGFDYRDRKQVAKQRKTVRQAVRKYKNHPAILLWGLGNEMEGFGPSKDYSRVLREVNELAKIVKREDSEHPVMTVIAGLGKNKAIQVKKYCPEIDILGVNSYAGALSVPHDLEAQGWDKPFMLTEFGPFGHWETPKTGWGAAIEQTSTEKAANYYRVHQQAVEKGRNKCVGTFAFFWGYKQEYTATWFGMLLQSGERVEAADSMSYAWTGKYPENRAPQVHDLHSSAALKRIPSDSIQKASVVADDPEHDSLNYRWIVVAESSDKKHGGDEEQTPPSFPELIRSQTGSEVTFMAPSQSGAYRLFVYVTDNQNSAATANFPFYVN